jgi:hypothetical protein
MPKITVVYKAREGDNKAIEAFGHTFFDGKPEEIDVSDEVAEKIKKNPVFNPGGPPERPGKAEREHK